jgi:hypothetical protein
VTRQQRADQLLAEYQASKGRNMNPDPGPSGFDFREPPDGDPEIAINRACETALNSLDELVALAADKSTAHLVAADWRFIDQIVTRAQMLGTFIQTRQLLRIVKNG